MPLDEDDLWGLTDYELYLARNEIYTRHGREFINEDLSAYFDGKTWYMPFIAPEDFSDAMLSQVERDDLQVILAEEEDRGPPYL